MNGYVYLLKDAKCGTPLYIGSTTIAMQTRFSAHLSCIKTSQSPIYRWVRDNNVAIDYEILSKVSFRDKQKLFLEERRWVKKYLNEGYDLKNVGYAVVESNSGSPSGSIRVDPQVLRDAKVICAGSGTLIQDYATEAIREKNSKTGKK